MKDTVRILVSWKCNLKCSYCCNDQERFRSEIAPASLHDIDFSKYSNVCITGGEPLLFLGRVEEICKKASDNLVILYSNGILFTPEIAKMLEEWGISFVNIGLHDPKSFKNIIQRVSDSTKGTSLKVRFHMNEDYFELSKEFPESTFKFWKMDDCERENEDRVVLNA